MPRGRPSSPDAYDRLGLAAVRGSFESLKMNCSLEYDSLLERQLFELLEECPEVASYFEQPIAIPYLPSMGDAHEASSQLDYATDVGPRYVPDVAVNLVDGRALFIEVKPRGLMALANNVERYVALCQYCEDTGFGWLVLDSSGPVALTDVIALPVAEDFHNGMLERLHEGPVPWHTVRRLMRVGGVSHSELNGYIMRENLVWTSVPDQVRAPSRCELSTGPWGIGDGLATLLAQSKREAEG